jgi:hypothetical protein
MSSNLFKYLIPAASKGLESGFEQGNKMQEEEKRTAEQEKLRKWTIEDADKRQEKSFQQAKDLQKSSQDYGFEKQKEADRLKGIGEQRKADLKVKEDQEKKQKQTQSLIDLQNGYSVDPKDPTKKNPFKTKDDWFNKIVEAGYTPSQALDKYLEYTAPNHQVERKYKGVSKPDKNGMISEVGSTQKWDGEKYVTTETSQGKPTRLHDGDNTSPILTKMYDEKFKTIVDYEGIINQAKNSGGIYTDSKGVKWTAQQIREEQVKTKNEYAQMVKDYSTDNFNEFNKQIYNASGINKKSGKNPEPEVYWKELCKSFIKDEGIKGVDMTAGANYMRATYGIDPISKYGVPEFGK